MAVRADPRSIRLVVDGVSTHEGAGFEARRPFPTRALDHVDPFLLLDEMGPTESLPGEARGAPDHPHRGIETITYLLEGELEHRDSRGNAGTLRAGDVQWMTAGDGVVHAELPSAAFQRSGGRMHGFQLWVNLPRDAKRVRPRYQEFAAAELPVVRTSDGGARVRVIAGEALGVIAPTRAHTPLLVLHVSLAPGGRLVLPVQSDWNALAWVFDGRARLGPGRLPSTAGRLAVFDSDGGVVVLEADAEEGPGELLLLAGEPIGEPIARYGPFVMNEEAEIAEAIEDYRAGRMGEIRPEILGTHGLR